MEALASVAVITQLLGQTIAVTKTVRDAIASIKLAESTIEEHKSWLSNLVDTLDLIQGEKELQTKAIEEQVAQTQRIVTEAESLINRLKHRQTKSHTRQFFHFISTGNSDAERLERILNLANSARLDLNTRILSTNVGLTGDVRDGTMAAWPVIQRVDRNVQRVLGERTAIARHLEGRVAASRPKSASAGTYIWYSANLFAPFVDRTVSYKSISQAMERNCYWGIAT